MSFDLRITFIGLCLFVPESSDGPMHVLLPATDGHNGHDDGELQPHSARLVYDTAHTAQGQTAFRRELACPSLEGFALDLRGLSRGSIGTELPDEFVDMGAIPGGGKVGPTLVGSEPGTSVTSRITLDAGHLTAYELGILWRFRNAAPQPMTWRAEWTIRGIEGDRLEARKLESLHGNDPESLPELFPIGETIHLSVYHVLPRDLPGAREAPIAGLPTADHFRGYYRLFPSAGEHPVPQFHSKWLSITGGCREGDPASEGVEQAGAESRSVLGVTGGEPYTCMLAKASLA